MLPTARGSVRLFRLARIDVSLHWSWFVAAVLEIQLGTHRYHSYVWNVLEFLSLFFIVLLHEFGHALACRQVGGEANQIVLWPLGGVAYVAPPLRPGATLWTIAAGPLVNVALLPILYGLMQTVGALTTNLDLAQFIVVVFWINGSLLIFNLLPVYPLDGGQILRALLWYPFGRARSLLIVSIIGFFGVAGLLVLAYFRGSQWLGLIALFVLLRCGAALRQARILAKLEAAGSL